MAVIIYKLIGYPQYYIKDKILYRKSYKSKHVLHILHYFEEREIKRTFKDGIEGYYLVKNNIRKFHSLKSLKHRLKSNE